MAELLIKKKSILEAKIEEKEYFDLNVIILCMYMSVPRPFNLKVPIQILYFSMDIIYFRQ